MLSQFASTLGLLARSVANGMFAALAIEAQVSPSLTTATVLQSWPLRPKQITSPGNRLSQAASMTPLLASASWNLFGERLVVGSIGILEPETDVDAFCSAEILSQKSPGCTV